jgi:hypothetical protein
MNTLYHALKCTPSTRNRLPRLFVAYLQVKITRPAFTTNRHIVYVCPGATFEILHLGRGCIADQRFFDPAAALDLPLPIHIIKDTQPADAKDDILFISAHNITVKGVVDIFPKKAND